MDATLSGKGCIDVTNEVESQSDNADVSLRDDCHVIPGRPSRNSRTTVTQFSDDRHAITWRPPRIINTA